MIKNIVQRCCWTQNPAGLHDINSWISLTVSPMLAVPECVTWAVSSISLLDGTVSALKTAEAKECSPELTHHMVKQ